LVTHQSANGAEYESQGQARSEAERVAPGKRKQSDPALKARNTRDISAFQALFDRAISQPGATYLALLGTCPWLSYFAPLALCFDFCAKQATRILIATSELMYEEYRNATSRDDRR
jgi:hypothetical protein